MNSSQSSSEFSELSSQTTALFPYRVIYALLAFLALTILIGLGHPPLIDPDEPVYGETGRVMAASHSFAAWWTPHYNGAMWFDKPPMTYWLVGLSMTLFGANDFAARFPMALATLALVWVVAWLAWRLYPASRTTPFWAALVFGTCAQTLNLSRACVTDMLLALCLTAALLGVWRWAATGRWLPALGVGLAVGLGTLVKGPVAIVLVGAQILLYLLLSRQAARLAAPQIWVALLISLVVAAPWYAGMVHLHGQFFIRSFLEAQNVTRYVKAEHAATSGPFFFVPVLLVSLLPWTLAAVPAVVSAFSRAKAQNANIRADQASPARDVAPQNPDLFALIWAVLVFVFFSISQSKLITYIYPMVPLLACVIAYWVAENSTRVSAAILSVSMLVLVYIGYIGAGVFLHERGTYFALAIMAVFITAVWAFASGFARSPDALNGRAYRVRYAVPGLALALLLPIASFSHYWDNPDPKAISAERAAQVAARAAQPGACIYCLVFNKPSVVYYSHHQIVFTDKRKLIANLLITTPSAVCITKPDVIADMARRGILPPHAVLSVIRNKAVVISGQTGKPISYK